ncbi:hypothetical protein BLL42_27070 (plasmid) [Pseudomonas frederiksbergensis]|uniref:DUF5983 domain-containing protein n=1 Tax=Pseudomonas frederiksbergensis TaxID=104087 RepID=A0A1J0ETU9_9PSED|nr:DUF5983 family protein [Pseudomonas frederiksbergensis]APC19403.1 hypothetical protein BLL42_27070 [Pseudomonas frederiksbergensis]
MKLLDIAAVQAVELSTAHITQADSKCLERLAARYVMGEGEAPYVFDSKHGFVIMIGAITVAKIKLSGISNELASLLDAALDEGLLIVAFDKDGNCHEELPSFDW